MINDLKAIDEFSMEIRKAVIEQIATVGKGHVGGSLSIVDALACLYSGVMKIDPKNPAWEERDRLVMSKGHAGPALYATLALKGYFPTEMLKTLNQPNTLLPSHCDHYRTPGIDMTTGSLGQGASSAVGIAIANRLSGRDSYTYLILGDGECDEGEVWEAAALAGHKKLDRLIALIDRNHYQIDGSTEDVLALGDLGKRFEQFGWKAIDVENGNDTEQVYHALMLARTYSGAPTVVILNTVKGFGWDYAVSLKHMCHSMSVTKEQAESFQAELQQQMKNLE